MIKNVNVLMVLEVKLLSFMRWINARSCFIPLLGTDVPLCMLQPFSYLIISVCLLFCPLN